jgi:hypothetical protein
MAYRYEHLAYSRQIRIFVLDRSNFSSTISGHFVRQSVDAPMKYDALSYVWGESRRDKTILCDGKIIHVTRSLYVALEAYRRTSQWKDTEGVPIWADGICINQDDPHEQAEQVRMMDEIYRQATFVTVWLGEPSADSDLAMDFILELNRDLTSLRRSNAAMEYFEDLEMYGLRPKHDPAWMAFRRLFTRPWFTRVWILQEVILGKQVNVTCGTKTVAWETLTAVLENMKACKIAAPQQTPMNFAFIVIAKADLESDQRPSLVRLLGATQNFASTKPVDKVFSLLGLAKDGQDYLHHVDYIRTTAQTFQAVARTMVQTPYIFEMFTRVYHPKLIESLPSWVPDWTYDESQITWTPFSFYSFQYDAAAGSMEASWTIDPLRPEFLGIRGSIVDEIRDVGPSMIRLLSVQDTGTYKYWDDECQKLISRVYSYPTGESPETAHWRARIGNLSFNGQFADASFGRSYAAWREFIDIEVSGRKVDASRYRQLDFESEAFATAQGQVMHRRRFCTTRKGYFGMVPATSQVGDSVCIFSGCHVPFILHPIGSSNKLVGQCYIHGIMFGEAVQRSEFFLQTLSLI